MTPSSHAVPDALRLAALRRSGLLDTGAEPSFDRLTRLATRFLNVPVALVSLVDEDRQFFKSQCGLPEPWSTTRETPLSHSFCQHVVNLDEPLIVEDARVHPLVEDNLAILDLSVIAYAGIPLRTRDGQALGSFCAIDSEPRAWTPDEIGILSDLAAAVETEIRLRLEAAERHTSDERFRLLVEQSPDVIAHLGLDLRHAYVSPAVQKAGLAPEAFLGRTHIEAAAEYGIPEPFASQWTQGLMRVREHRQEERIEFSLPHPDGEQHWECQISPFFDAAGALTGFLGIGRDVTMVRQAERALRESERRFRQMAESIRDVFWVTDVDLTQMLYISPAYADIWGRSCESLYQDARLWLESIHPDDRDRVVAAAVENRERGFDLEYRILRPDGQLRWIHDRGFPVADADSTVRRVAGIAEDITTYKVAEAHLLRRDAILGSIAEVAEHLVLAEQWRDQLPTVLSLLGEATLSSRCYYLERDGRSADVPQFSQSAKWVREGTESQGENREPRGFTFPEPGLAGWGSTLQRGDTVSMHTASLPAEQQEHFRAQGIRSLLLVPVFAGGEWSGVLGFDECDAEREWSVAEREALRAAASTLGAAIERQRADEALRQTEERFREAAETVPQVIWMFSPDFSETLYLSPAYERIWGLPLDTGYREPQSFVSCVHPDDQPLMLDAMARVREGHTQVPEYRIRRPDGVERWLRGSGSPVRDGAGEVLRVVGITEDVTERRQLESQLRHAQKMESVGRLAGGVAHDFNNMLTAIGGFAAFLEGEVEKGSDAAEYVQEIRKATSRAADLTRQLLAFGRRQTLRTKVLDINDVVRDSEKLLRRLIPTNIEIDVELAPDAGQVRVDPTQMHQVLLNLVVNARDAMPEGGVLSIRTAHQRVVREPAAPAGAASGDYVAVTVRDTGTGMDPETLARAFEPFFTRKAEGQGTGLGLATVEGIISQSGGHIHVDSQEGKGSSFTVFLPRETEAEPVVRTPQASNAVPSGGGTVLLVEDEAMVRNLTRRVLMAAGYAVLDAENGEEAMRLYDEQDGRIDLLLTDAMMPRMGGKALALSIRARDRALPIIVMSGYSGDLLDGDARLPEGVTFLQKPFVPNVLVGRVATAIGTASAGE